MPISPVTSAPILTGTLLSNAIVGVATPRLASGVANGLSLWLPTVTVNSTAAGTLGVGAGLVPTIPVPTPVLYAALVASFASRGLLGVMSPLVINGLAAGLSLVFLQGQVVTTQPNVGVGAGVATFAAPPAGPLMSQGFVAAGLTGIGQVQLASAIGDALGTVFSALVLPLAVAGSPSIVPSSGPGTGKIL